MVGISVRVALDDVHSWCRVCVVRGVWRVLRAPSPSGYEESSEEAPQVARGGAQPGRNTGGAALPRCHLQGRCSPWEPWEDEPAYFKAASGHCVLDVQLGWLMRPKTSGIEPVAVGICTEGTLACGNSEVLKEARSGHVISYTSEACIASFCAVAWTVWWNEVRTDGRLLASRGMLGIVP